MDNTQILAQIKEAVIKGRHIQNGSPGVKELVGQALDQSIDFKIIINKGIFAGMEDIGDRFGYTAFMPEFLLASRAANTGIDILKESLGSEYQPKATAIIGIVGGDPHTHGMSLVSRMLRANGYDVYDLDRFCTPEGFTKAIVEHSPQLVALSAPTTYVFPTLRRTIEQIEAMPQYGSLRIIAGGACMNERTAKKWGAHDYAPDALEAVKAANDLMANLQ